VPTPRGWPTPKTTYKNGQACPAKSKYAGQTGKVVYAYWSSIAQKKPTITTNSTAIKFSEYMRVTMAFEPTGVTPTRRPQRDGRRDGEGRSADDHHDRRSCDDNDDREGRHDDHDGVPPTTTTTKG
jgi:hypothetical protein